MNKTDRLREFARYVSLNILGMIALSCYILADTFFVSQGMGRTVLPPSILPFRSTALFTKRSDDRHGRGHPLFHSKSQGEDRLSNRTFTHALYLGAVFAVLFVLTGLFFSGTIVEPSAQKKMYSSCPGLIFGLFWHFLRPFFLTTTRDLVLRNDGAPQLAMAGMIGGSLSNIVLDWVFIFPCGWGIFGAAFATGLAPIISILILSPHFLRKKNGFRPVRCRPEAGQAGWILSSGVPSLVTEVSSGIVMIVFNSIIMGLCQNVGVAAYGVIANLSLVILSIYTGISQGIQPLISRSFGAGGEERNTPLSDICPGDDGGLLCSDLSGSLFRGVGNHGDF